MSTSAVQIHEEAAALALHAKRLSWVMIILIAFVLTLAYAAVLIVVEHYWPHSAQFIQAAGHVAITIAVILIVRKIEEPIIEKDRAALIETIQSKYDSILQSSLPLLASTNAIGLTQVYPTRNAAEKAIGEAILATKWKLLMIGVAFFETFSIERSCDAIADRIEDPEGASKDATASVDARFLLLNPYTTPAVIRSFMESPPDEARHYLEGGGKSFLSSTLYGDWRRAFHSFDNEVFRKRVKFYRRDPGLWMVVTDTKVFFEPYTLGRSRQARHRFDRRLGGHMPVFEFDRGSSSVSKILEEHFERLWTISQDSMETLKKFYDDNESAANQLDTHVFDIRRQVLEPLVEQLTKEEQAVGLKSV